MLLDSKLDFDEHVKGILDKTSKCIEIIRKHQHFLPRWSILEIYKSFVRPYLCYGDIIYEAFMGPLQQKFESIQYSTALATTVAIRGTYRGKH